MLTLFVLVPLVLAALAISVVVRLVTGVLGLGRRRHLSRYNGGFGYGRRSGLGSSLLSILALVALDRLFTSRRF